MHTVSEEYKRIMNGDHSFEVRVTIDGHVYDKTKIFSIETDRKIFTDDMAIGLTPSGEIDLEIIKPSETFSRMAKIVPEVAIVDEYGVVLNEWIKKGEYFIDTKETVITGIENEDRIHIFGYDAMLKTGREYPEYSNATNATGYSGLTFSSPEKTYDIVSDICGICGITLNTESLNILKRDTYTISYRPVEYTLREILGFIGVMHGGNFYINDAGEMAFAAVYEIFASNLGKLSYIDETETDENKKEKIITFGTGDNEVMLLV